MMDRHHQCQCHSSPLKFRETKACDIQTLYDGVKLANSNNDVIMPWIGYGTYKIGKSLSRQATYDAIKYGGYRCIDTAFVYGGETTEMNVGLAIQDVINDSECIDVKSREDIVVITKHWRNYHGYEPTLQCLELSLQRLQVEYIDIWLMHWPGPPWQKQDRKIMKKKKRKKKNNNDDEASTISSNNNNDEDGDDDDEDLINPWDNAELGVKNENDMMILRSETWRGMEDALKMGKVKAIGVSNFNIQHLQKLKETATIWPPCINQIECHPLYPQMNLIEYCHSENIVVQAYGSLGGQDTGKNFYKQLYPSSKEQQINRIKQISKLYQTPPVMKLTKEINNNNNTCNDNNNDNDDNIIKNKKEKTSCQILLRWAIDKNIAVIPKASTIPHMIENTHIMDFRLSKEQINVLESSLKHAVENSRNRTTSCYDDNNNDVENDHVGRLCWRNEPLRLLQF